MAESLKSILEAYKSETLNAMLAYNNLRIVGKRTKAQVVAVLADQFSKPSHIQASLARLGAAGREVVNQILRLGGKASLISLQNWLENKRLIVGVDGRTSFGLPVASNPSYQDTDSRQIDEIMANLTALGLVFTSPVEDEYGQFAMLGFELAQQYFIPSSLIKHYPPPPPAPAWNPQFVETPYQVRESSARTFQRDLYLYWSYVDRNTVELTMRGMVAKRHLLAINNTLLHKETISTGEGEADVLRLMFLREMLRGLGLLRVQDSTLQTCPANAFLALSPAERIKRCLEGYTACREINELLWFVKLVPTSYDKPALPAPDALIDARRSVLLYLKPAVRWMKIDSIVQNIKLNQYEFLFQRGYRKPHIYYHPPHSYSAATNPMEWDFPGISQEDSGWNTVEGGLIRTILRGPLYWMGLVDLGFSDKKQTEPDIFRLTAVGAWLLAGAPAPEIPQSGGQVIVQPDFTITALDPVNDHTLYTLEQFAQRLSAERAVMLRLTQKSVYAAQQQGWDAGRIQACLEQLTGQPLPGNLARTLQDWQQKHERITIMPGLTLLHAADANALQELAKDPALKELFARQPAPGLVILPEVLQGSPPAASLRAQLPAKTSDIAAAKPKLSASSAKALSPAAQRLTALLFEREWVPVIVNQPDKLPARSTRADGEGILRPLHQPASLYLRAFLASLAEPAADGSFRLTRESVQRAVRSGLTAPTIIEELNHILVDPVPGTLEKRIIAWAGHFGTVRLDAAALLNFKDEQTLKELLSDPELAPYLRTIKPNDLRTTVWVEAVDLERVARLLEERGIEIKRRS